MNLTKRTIAQNLLYLFAALMSGCSEKSVKVSPGTGSSAYTKAWAFYQQHKQDSAYHYYAKAAAETKDSAQLGGIFVSMAIIQSDQGDYYGSDEMAIRSLHYFSTNDSYLPSVYNAIAINKYKLKDFEGAADWYERAMSMKTDSINHLVYANNLGVTYTELGRYSKAFGLFKNLLTDKLLRADTEKYARSLDNYHWVRWKINPAYDALPGYFTALRLRQKIGDVWGVNASYAHIADFYGRINSDSAFKYADLMYSTARQLKSPDDQLEGLQKLARFGPATAAGRYFERYASLQDSLLAARNAAGSRFAVIRYETEKAKADNLTLQKDNTDQRYRLLRQQFLLYCLLAVIAVAAVLVIGFVRRRQARLRREAAERLRAQQLRTAKRVHDVLANDLYRIMSDLDNGTAGANTALADRLEIVYQRARDLSYEDEPVPLENFELHLSGMLNAFGTETTKVLPDGCTADFWKGTTDIVKQELSLVLQELMINMRKHSRATLVTIVFRRSGKQCEIIYTDNGVGMSDFRRGNGITHTENRMSAIGGNINFVTSRESGLQIHISFPSA
ncbi:ATP-binding protein [Mucilaginibacter achroorhodeus]|uniref:histidine kinase n=1 Tax=Mucilaginibacter achroorhodeus TaxID=2599294 RepID=A0A563U628_9SPHI|nr:tetratricopeptide repeat protein [Mucilaginibacter achroorhodeus]TWR26802.1 ATP-binding protein [Mucilaginibacter achroorhodeus]